MILGVFRACCRRAGIRAHGRSSDPSSGCDPRRVEPGAGPLNAVLARMPGDINRTQRNRALRHFRTGFWPWPFVRNHNAIALLNPLSPNGANISSSEYKPQWQLCAQFKTSRDHARRRRSRPQGLLRDRGLVRNVGARVVQLSEGQPDMLTPAAIHELF